MSSSETNMEDELVARTACDDDDGRLTETKKNNGPQERNCSWQRKVVRWWLVAASIGECRTLQIWMTWVGDKLLLMTRNNNEERRQQWTKLESLPEKKIMMCYWRWARKSNSEWLSRAWNREHDSWLDGEDDKSPSFFRIANSKKKQLCFGILGSWFGSSLLVALIIYRYFRNIDREQEKFKGYIFTK